MRVAAVDIGTNTVRVLVADHLGEVERTELVTGLGRGVDATGHLAEDAVDRTIAALRSMVPSLASAQSVRVTATSASRDADNRELFFDQVEQAVGTRPELLSGEEEADLSFAGATAGLTPERTTVVDLGGGSTEIISGAGTPAFRRSFDIGSVRLTDRMLEQRPVAPATLEKARLHIRATIDSTPEVTGRLVGVGGSFQTLGLVLAGSNHGVSVTRSQLDGLVEDLALLTFDATSRLPGVKEGRDGVILGGALIGSVVMDALGSDAVRISRHDLLDGMVALLLAQSRSG